MSAPALSPRSTVLTAWRSTSGAISSRSTTKDHPKRGSTTRKPPFFSALHA